MAEEPTLAGLLLRARALARLDAADCVEVRHLLAATARPSGRLEGDAAPLPLSAQAQAVIRTAAELARRDSDAEQRAGIVPFIRTAAVLRREG
ncbi:MAG TPA: hypothetical protein VE570_03470 [Thermoleophilaceae bacterium]|jgi:hypothetical protein|nr:hypothetical protein [Thermoleophilaceae bacterium]